MSSQIKQSPLDVFSFGINLLKIEVRPLLPVVVDVVTNLGTKSTMAEEEPPDVVC